MQILICDPNGSFHNLFFLWIKKYKFLGNSLAIQWLGLGTLCASAPGLILGQGSKIPQARRYG